MAISVQYNHYGLLNRWPLRMSESQWRFNIFSDDSGRLRTLRTVYFQKHREALAEALGSSFELAKFYLGYNPSPAFTEDYVIHFNERYPWWQQSLHIPERKLIGFGKPKYEEVSINPTYTAIEKSDTSFVPGYQVSLDIPSDVSVEDRTYKKLRDRYRFFLSPSAEYQTSVVQQENLLLTHTYPIIQTQGDVTTYSFIIPAWELVNYEDRFDDFMVDTQTELEYVSSATWGDDGVSISSSASVQLREYTLDDTDAVQLLSLPSETSNESETVKTSVEATIVDPDRGEFRLKHETLPSLTSYPYGVKVSYLSGLDYQLNGNMDAQLERAIIALANTKVQFVTIPTSSDTAVIYNGDRDKIFNEEFEVNPEYVNPMGLQYGHFMAWSTFAARADRVTGGVYRF